MEIITEECLSLSLLAILSNFSSSITTSIIFYSIWNLLIGIFLSKFLSCLTIPLNHILIFPQLVPFFICLSSYRYFTIFMSRCIPIFSWFLLLFTLPCPFLLIHHGLMHLQHSQPSVRWHGCYFRGFSCRIACVWVSCSWFFYCILFFVITFVAAFLVVFFRVVFLLYFPVVSPPGDILFFLLFFVVIFCCKSLWRASGSCSRLHYP